MDSGGYLSPFFFGRLRSSDGSSFTLLVVSLMSPAADFIVLVTEPTSVITFFA